MSDVASVQIHLGFAAVSLLRFEAVFAGDRGASQDMQRPHFHATNQSTTKLAAKFAASEAVVDEVGRSVENKQDFFDAGQDERPLGPSVARVFT